MITNSQQGVEPIPESALSIEEKIKVITQNIATAKNQISILEAKKNMVIVQCFQFKRDYNVLHEAYKRIEEDIRLGFPEQKMGVLIQSGKRPQVISCATEQEIKENEIQKNDHKWKQTYKISSGSVKYVVVPGKSSILSGSVELQFSLFTNCIINSLDIDSSGKKCAFTDGVYLHLLNIENSEIQDFLIPKHLQGESGPIKFSRDGSCIAFSCHTMFVTLFNLEQTEWTDLEKKNQDVVTDLYFTYKNDLVCGTQNGHISIWNINNNSITKSLDSMSSPITGICENSEGTEIYFAHSNGTVIALEGDVLRSSYVMDSPRYAGITVSPSNGTFAIYSCDKTINLGRARGNSLKMTGFLEGHGEVVYTVAFSHHEPILVSGSRDGIIIIWDQVTNDILYSIRAHTGSLMSIVHSPKGRSFFSCASDGCIFYWKY